MPENLSIGKRTEIVIDVIRLTEAEDVDWQPGGDLNSFTSVRAGAVAVIERTQTPERVRLRFQAVDDAVPDVVIEQAYPADDEPKELQNLYATLDKLWRIAEKLAVPNAADLFLRGEA
jgi:hypothetical protein